MQLVFLAGSLRVDSLNKKFVKEAMAFAETMGVQGEFIDLKEYDIPLYDGDVEASSGIPKDVARLGQKIREADAVVISTPEYNGSISGVLKNVIDWLSREKPISISGKYLLLLAATMGGLSGVRGLWHSRVPFEAINVHVFPGMMGLPVAHNAFNSDGKLIEEKTREQLRNIMQDFITHARKK